MPTKPSTTVSNLLNAAAALSVVENIIADQEAQAATSFGKVELAESSFKSGAKEYPKHSIRQAANKKNVNFEKASGPKLFGGILTNVGQDWLKSQGGYGKFAAWMWQGIELGKTMGGFAGGTIAWPIALAECGFFALDIWEEQIKLGHTEAVNDLTKKFDRVVHVHTELVRKFRVSGQTLLKACEALPTRIIPYWSEGSGQKALRALASGSGNPAGRKILIGLTKKALLNHLILLDAARYELYLLGTNCNALVKHGENVNSNSSNAICGFPDYEGYRLPQRGQIIHSETSSLAAIAKQCDGCETRLSNVAFNLWSLVGYQLEMKQSEASSMGF